MDVNSWETNMAYGVRNERESRESIWRTILSNNHTNYHRQWVGVGVGGYQETTTTLHVSSLDWAKRSLVEFSVR